LDPQLCRNNKQFCQYLTPRSRVVLEKLIVTQLVKKFALFYRTRRFITVFTRIRHWSLSCSSRWSLKSRSSGTQPRRPGLIVSQQVVCGPLRVRKL